MRFEFDYHNDNGKVTMNCKKGSIFWALSQLARGAELQAEGKTFLVDNDGIQVFDEDNVQVGTFAAIPFMKEFINTTFSLIRKPLFNKGDWLFNEKYRYYCEVLDIRDFSYSLREAGSEYTNITTIECVHKGFVLASLEPRMDMVAWTNVFHITLGKVEIIIEDGMGDRHIMLPSYPHYGRYKLDGRKVSDDKYPTLFESYEQAKAYLAEANMKTNKE